MRKFAPYTTILLILLAACTSSPGGSSEVEAGEQSASTLGDLRSVDEFKARFNRDSGLPRLLLLVSPT